MSVRQFVRGGYATLTEPVTVLRRLEPLFIATPVKREEPPAPKPHKPAEDAYRRVQARPKA